MTSDILNNSDEFKDQTNNNEIELRDLVHQALEREGFLTRLKAQLRAAIFKTIDDSSSSLVENLSSTERENLDESIARGIFLDWLENSNLFYTKDIFQVETSSKIVLDRQSLIEKLNLKINENKSSTLIDLLIKTRHDQITILPEYIKQSIESKFPHEKINDSALVRNHFRSLFNASFDENVLDAFINKMLPLTSTSVLKSQYEQICLKWLQSCSQVLNFSSINSTKNGEIVSRARRDLTLFADSTSSSSSISEQRHDEP